MSMCLTWMCKAVLLIFFTLTFFPHLGLGFVGMGINFSQCCLLAGSLLVYYYTVANLQS